MTALTGQEIVAGIARTAQDVSRTHCRHRNADVVVQGGPRDQHG
ncbi:hypothetical protein ABZ369_03465 [Streptomyces sp. NPDC005918]